MNTSYGIGFFAKVYLVRAALEAPSPQVRLVVALVLTSVVSAGYYLRVVMVMFMRPRRDGAVVPARAGFGTSAVIFTTAVLIVVLGLYPPAITSFFGRGRDSRLGNSGQLTARTGLAPVAGR